MQRVDIKYKDFTRNKRIVTAILMVENYDGTFCKPKFVNVFGNGPGPLELTATHPIIRDKTLCGRLSARRNFERIS